MPEGDVLLRVARRLTRALADTPLARSDIRWPDVADADLTGARSLGTHCYGKHLLTRFDDGRTLHTHLRMDGRWLIRPTRTPAEVLGGPMIRVVLGTSVWTCVGDHLGMVDLVRTRDEPRLLRHLGPNLMADEVDFDTAVGNASADPSRAIGAVLLDQAVAAGIGTIYLAETLWRHQINPWRPAGQVTDLAGIFRTAATLMRRSADAPQLTATGLSSQATYVHGRAGLACARCSQPIAVAPIGDPPMERPAFFCPTCQP